MSKIVAMKAALDAPEDDVVEDSRRIPHSFAMLVENLEVGEIASRTLDIDPNLPWAEYDATVNPLRVRLRNNVAPAVKRAKENVPGAQYRVEVVDIRLTAGPVLVVCVTRTA
jgi:hypothetical protein